MYHLPDSRIQRDHRSYLRHGAKKNLHNAMVKENSDETLHNSTKPVVFVPENATADKVLRLLLKKHCQLSVVVDEYGSVTGVLAMEDIIESILGQEIFEHDDLAVDMAN